jgi:hypothetical protein
VKWRQSGIIVSVTALLIDYSEGEYVTVWSRFMFCFSVSFMTVYRVILYWGESTGWRTILTALLRVVNNA